MPHITLVRHGQANSTAKDEVAYDRLSDLGRQQARWLGAHLRDSGEGFARVYAGTLRRHQETAVEMAAEDVVLDPRLNELEYFTLSQLMATQHGIAIPTDRPGFLRHMPVLLSYWQEGKLDGAPESFADFESRVRDVLTEIADGPGRALVVTSGGLIGMTMRITMGLDLRALAHACLAIQNTSLHRYQPLPTGLVLMQFNALPHLDHPDRHHARTHL
ncbi:hypothetical protein P775_09475 [Puniceibacterium antarcticum]|uniref:Phosphoglycerate mutase n=1 Tax=Puniceibacterium antarcticum TaxID=1206336 RepID=A0A2G8RFT2_9RHOB|nr:histidine phosphatase family protein [Puniceibacterium antarcticum]PIL20444.1 hypothetical protein P775_09475 [Puniceibacterium antarcticum]